MTDSQISPLEVMAKAGLKKVDLFQIANEDILSISDLKEFLRAALLALAEVELPERMPIEIPGLGKVIASSNLLVSFSAILRSIASGDK